MPKVFEVKLLEDYDVNTNDFTYVKGQVVSVTELESFRDNYAIYHNLTECNILDWIPKKIVKII
jgi:hypothetical protein